MTTTPQDTSVTGHCYCGGIRFAVRIPAGARPIFTAYCHCDSCRRAHAAPLYHVVCVEARMFQITHGADLLTEFTRPGASLCRAFCGTCGTRILNRFPSWRPGGRVPLAFFPNLLDAQFQRPLPEVLRPRKNNRPEECVLDAAILAQVLDRGPVPTPVSG